MSATAALTPLTQPAAQASQPAAKESDSGFGFDDFIDLINPLQHIPIISTLYQHLTGDKIGTVEKIAGDTLYGGLVGFASSLGDTLFEQVTGKTVGDTVYAYLLGNAGGNPAVAMAPVSFQPVPTLAVAMPDLTFLSETAESDAPQIAATAQYATAAYGKAALRSYEVY
jgi:hypothetical protein